ncbi:hypothetical protein BESB_049530 [Besnoitia besnoiti]|uniref:Uncharacterized protein n=1 Tax=Besnoitia besnoiti TaxID=94643 RepID=A0A2A9MKF7_BESBE|nr:hypothetical protein BESB_049530 [Besnoitia besnoiti]PFH36761.1 hypothetical protein BESB_049530 [Besnoitia besnoiti]
MKLLLRSVRLPRIALALYVVGIICATYHMSCVEVPEQTETVQLAHYEMPLADQEHAQEIERATTTISTTDTVTETIQEKLPAAAEESEGKAETADVAETAERRLAVETADDLAEDVTEGARADEADKTSLAAETADDESAAGSESQEEANANEENVPRILASVPTETESEDVSTGGEEPTETDSVENEPSRRLSDKEEEHVSQEAPVAANEEDKASAVIKEEEVAVTESEEEEAYDTVEEAGSAQSRRLRGAYESEDDANADFDPAQPVSEENASESHVTKQELENTESPTEAPAAGRRLQSEEVVENVGDTTKTEESDTAGREEEGKGETLEDEHAGTRLLSAQASVEEQLESAPEDDKSQQEDAAQTEEEGAETEGCPVACKGRLTSEEAEEASALVVDAVAEDEAAVTAEPMQLVTEALAEAEEAEHVAAALADVEAVDIDSTIVEAVEELMN